MKLLLHYLKFDLLARGTLLKLLWLMVPVFVWLMAIIAGWRTPSDKVVALQITLNGMFVAGAVLFGFICLFAGGTDSTARAKTWLMTRPRHGWARAGSRVLIILGGAVLPVMVAWWGTLWVMGFDAASMAAHFPRMLFTTLAVAAVLALLGLLPLCIQGVIIGALPGFLPLFALLLPGARPAQAYYSGEPSALTVALACVAGLLTALPGVRRRLTRRAWAMQGFLCGLTAVTALLVFFPVQNWIAFRQPYTELLALRDLEEWRLEISPAQEVVAIPAGDGVSIQVPLARDERFQNRNHQNWMVHAFSWRPDEHGEWSPWIRQDISLGPNCDLTLILECEPGQVGDMNRGDLRLLATVPPEMRPIPAPDGDVTTFTGTGWRLEVLPLEVTEDSVELNFLRRRLPGIPQNHLTVGLWGATLEHPPGYHSGGWSGRRVLEMPWVDVDMPGQTARFIRFRATPPVAVAVTLPDNTPNQMRLLRVSGITLRAPQALPKDDPQAPARKSIWPQESAKPVFYTKGETVTGPRPLADALIPPLPRPDATEGEVARYLHELVGIAERRVAVEGMAVVLREQQFAPLVPRWLPLILRLAERKQYATPNAVRMALVKAASEEQRQAIISRLPFAPVLMEVVDYRNWLAEARPFVIETVLRDEQIPNDGYWYKAVLQYRDPSLAPVLRKLWAPTKVNVRIWESLPELAAELPAKLEEMREYVRGIGIQPDARDESVIEALLYAGDAVALEALLRLVRSGDRSGQLVRFHQIARDYLRDSDGNRLPWESPTMLPFIGDSTAADYRFDREQRAWIRQPKQP